MKRKSGAPFKKEKEKNSETMQIYLQPGLKREFEKVASQRNISVSSLVRLMFYETYQKKDRKQ